MLRPPQVQLPGVLRYQVLSGSHAYGLAGPSSDVDWRGIYQLPSEAYLGLWLPGSDAAGPPETVTLEPDQTYYELRHFARLCLAGNPNIMELLWADPALVAVSSPLAEALRQLRGSFFSGQMVAAYLGWAKSERLKLTDGGVLAAELGAKRGSHLVRLLLSLRTALAEGWLPVSYVGEQRDWLLAVKRGQRSPQAVLELIEQLEAECRDLAATNSWPARVEPAPLEALIIAARSGQL